jgi:cytochrome b561
MSMATAVVPRAAAHGVGPRRFDAVTIALHWTTVALIVAMFASGWGMGLAGDRAQEETLLYLHRSLGVLTWITALCRILWRLAFAFLPPFPLAMPKIQQRAARLSEYGLYALLLIQPLTGMAHSLARGRPFPVLAWRAPAVMARDKALAHLFHDTHELGAWILLGLIALHIAAALFHRFVARDEVFGSMAPWKPSPVKRLAKARDDRVPRTGGLAKTQAGEVTAATSAGTIFVWLMGCGRRAGNAE